MAHGYVAIQWNRLKVWYDLGILVLAVVFIVLFVAAQNLSLSPGESVHPVQTALRATGACAFFLLTLTLAIGPLARLTRFFAPLLYNRRHLGVATCLTALVHAGLVMVWYFGFAKLNPALALLISRPLSLQATNLPFELAGLAALSILVLLAATSHDYWQRVLTPLRWKRLHMAVYAAYGLVVAHVAFGPLLTPSQWLFSAVVLSSAGALAVLHLFTGVREVWRDWGSERAEHFLAGESRWEGSEAWLEVGRPQDIPDGRAVMVSPEYGERIAVFRDGDALYAVTNVCPHQNGPLGEGRIVDGCITCPWHGWQFRPGDGVSPPPFEEKVATYRLKLQDGTLYVRPEPMAPGSQAPVVLMSGSGT
jgi:nitrite reductase/ring-hydroxylating ferredoxin subunit/DMSO/TMAO reductase YedYZ heme-binding membrane subunit